MLLFRLFFSRLMFCIYLLQSVFWSSHILSTKHYCVCTLLLYTSHWKCLFRTEYLFQETLYVHNVRNDLFNLVLIHFDLTYLILLYLLYTNIYGPHWIFCIFFIYICINHVQNVYSERFLSVWFYLVYRSKFYLMMLHECCIYCIYVHICIYHSGRWQALIANKS